MKVTKKVLSLVMALVMVFSLIPFAAVGAEAANVEQQKSVPLDTSRFYTIFHLDCGRNYFSVQQIKNIIDEMAKDGFNTLELAIGNDGLRFLLDDMSVGSYSSDAVKSGIQAGNKAYRNNGTNELTQAEMDEILAYAKSKNIAVIPLINTPGHMDAIITAMKQVGIANPAYNGSARTVDVTNEAAVDFTLALVNKYIQYFAAQGCKIFNMGCDEYANDVYTSGSMGFGRLISAGHYDEFASFVNNMAAQVQNAGMTPMAFNDGIYFNNNTSVTFDKNIAIAYWTAGWSGYTPMSARDLEAKGHKIINTNDAWYYVVGRSSGTYGLSGARSGVQNTPVTDVPGTDPSVVSGAMQCVWYDENNSYNENEVFGLMSTLASKNPTYFTAAAPVESEEPAETPAAGDSEAKAAAEERSITVSVGSTVTDVIADTSITNSSVATDPTGIAAVSAKGETIPGETTYIIGDGTNWMVVNSDGSITRTTNSSEATRWSIDSYNGGYRIHAGDYYLYRSGNSLTASTQSATTWSYSDSYGFYNSGYYIYYSSNRSVWRAYSTSGYDDDGAFPYDEQTQSAGDQTTVSFTGVTPGTTTAQVGDVLYHITVTDAAPSNAMTASTLTLEYWITNFTVHTTTSSSSASSTTISYRDAQSEEGVAITNYAPNQAYSFFDGTVTVYYWQSMRLDANNKQTDAADDDETSDGTTFTHVRYHSGAWQYKTADGVWHYFLSTDQAVAYYLQKTEVTAEVDTYMKDWGYTIADKNSQYPHVALCVGVVYPDGTLSPDENGIYQNAILFNKPANSADRDIGIVAPTINGDYTIEKITYTYGVRANGSGNLWGDSDGINWNKTTTAAGSTWYDETVVWQESDGTTPMVNGKTSNIKWTQANTAYLILIYLKPVHHEDNLTVVWHDDSGDADILTQEVVVAKGVNFLNGLQPGAPHQAGEINLSDSAFIINNKNAEQRINKDLTIMQNIEGKYASGLYKYQSADISEDGKTLTLHYVLPDTTVYDPNYVVDFGLPMTFPLSDFVSNVNQVKSVAVTSNATYNAQNQTITFKPTGVLRGVEPISVYITFNDSTNPVQKNIGILPATTVYYEEGFASFGEGWVGGSTGSAEQTSERIVDKTESHKVNNYGYDPAYASNAAASNGTEATTSVKGASATFDFHGTGVDIYANCDSASGIFNVFVTDDDGKIVKFAMVNTIASGAYGNKVVSGAYNTKIVSIQGLAHGSYTVKLVNSSADKTVRFDGFRVYGTIAADDNAYYNADLEDSPKFIQMRNAVLTVANVSESDIPEGGGDQVFDQIDGSAEALVLNNTKMNPVDDAAELLNDGPKNELYLAPNQSLVFTVKTIRVVQLGMKAPAGATSYQINGGTETALNSSVDMFYTIANANTATDGKTITITNMGSNVLAITELKVCDDPSFALSTLTEEDIAAALDTIFAPAQPEVTYADAKLTVIVNSVSCELTANGVVGESHTFTADEIRAAAESLVAEGFSLDEADFSDVEVAFGEQSSVEFSASENQTEQPPEVNPFQQMIDLLIRLFSNLFGRH